MNCSDEKSAMKHVVHQLLVKVRRDSRASAAVEMALIAPVLIGLVVGIIDYAVYVTDHMRLSKGVASAVQFAMYNSDNDEGIRNVAYTASKFTSSQASVDVKRFCECPKSGSVSCSDTCAGDDHMKIFVSVGMQYAFKPIIPYPFVTSATISSSASIQVP